MEWDVDFPKVSRRVLWMARDLDDTRPAAALEATGARLVRGEGTLVDLRTVEVGGEQLVARRAVVIANGGTAAIPPIEGLNKVAYWTNRQAAIPRELPERLVVLGGGLGFYMRQHGLAIDCLQSTEIVTADGRRHHLTEDKDERPKKDLFWALCGGGGGNFGINTSFTFRTFEVPPQVTVFSMKWYSEDCIRAFLAFQEVVRSATDTLGTISKT